MGDPRRRVALGLVLLLVLVTAREASPVGSLTIPNVLASLAAGQQNLSLLDANWTAVASYINNREIAFGTLGARPAASVAGRWYYATDTAQLFADTGSTWTQVGGAVPTGAYTVRGLAGANNSGTPATKWDMSADQVALRNTSDGSLSVRSNTGTLTQDIGLAGPAANGRDQAGAFSTNSWLHLYFVWNGTTLATLSSTTAPPTGPALPTGYTSWAYAGVLRYGDAPALLNLHWRGSRMFYDTATRIISNGAQTAETTVSVASAVAPNATSFGMFVGIVDTAGGLPPLWVRVITARNYLPPINNYTGGALQVFFEATLPNVSQQFFFQWATAPSTGATFSIINAVMPNGDS